MATSTTSPSMRQANGVLPITASQTSGNAQRSSQIVSKLLSLKLKVIVRRLAPGLTEAEFFSVIGNEWKLGHGKVDWLLYKQGKDSKDPSKPSRPSRAYLHLTNEVNLMQLSDIVRQSVFEDAQNTYNSACLVGPPSVEFAPYGRTPVGRRRVDARAGTIDQDPEFMAFLEGLANPVTTKELNADGTTEGTSKEKVTTTPLVQYLKDKKASKNKESLAKAAKKQEVQLAKGKAVKESTAGEDARRKGKDVKPEKGVERAAKEAVKILNKEASKSSSSGTAAENTGPPKLDLGKAPSRQQRTMVAAHIRMLQRDLGLSPAQAYRQIRRDTADAQKAERASAAEKSAGEIKGSASQSTPAPIPSVPTGPKGNYQSGGRKLRGKGQSTDPEASSKPAVSAGPSTPMVLLKKPETPQPTPVAPASQVNKPSPAVAARRPPVAVPTVGATQAFVKHANPSQGVTEPLLKEAMERFGAVLKVEIDKRKGFAYAEFADTEGLKKAMAANPISVAQGTVQVMERKGTALPPDKKPIHQAPNAPRGGGRGGRGGTIGRRGGRGGGRGGANAGPSEGRAPSTAPTGPAAK